MMLAVILSASSGGVFRVHHLEITPHDIFDGAGFPYSIVNFFHLTTKPWVIADLLTFKRGDLVTPGILEENERRLRALGIFGDVQIVPMREGDTNIVWVGTWDNWTSSLYLDVARAGGGQRLGLGLVDHNFLGLAKDFSAKYQRDYERSYWELKYFDPNFWGSDLTLLYQDRSDGYRAEASLERPFRVVWDRLSWGVDLFSDSATVRSYQGGEVAQAESVRVVSGSAEALFNTSLDKVLAFGLKAVWWERRGLDTLLRRGLGPAVRYEERRYVKTRYLDGFGYTEDFPVGLSFGLAGFVYEGGLGAEASAEKGWARGKGLFVKLGARAAAHRVWGREWGEWSGEFRFYMKPVERLTFAALARSGYLWNPPGLTGYVLGGASGLRGWPLFELWGQKRTLFTGEVRLAGPALFRGSLVPGLVGFIDLGEMEGTVLWDVGFGLRLGFLKVFKFPTMRADLAWPRASGKPVLSIGTNQAF